MKLTSLKHGRDGRLVVVSNDLNWYTDAFLIAPTLQAALDDWERCEPLLRALAESLEVGSVPRGRFHEREAAAPLPRQGLATPRSRPAQGSRSPEPLTPRRASRPGRGSRIVRTPRMAAMPPTRPWWRG